MVNFSFLSYRFSCEPVAASKNKGRGKEENKKEEGIKNDENNNQSNTTRVEIALRVYSDSQVSILKVMESVAEFQGFVAVEVRPEDDLVIVKGNNLDPTKVADRIRKKSGMRVELISPLPETPKVAEVVLKVDMHCQSSAKAVVRCILKIQGFVAMEVNVEDNLVTVKGNNLDPTKVADRIREKSGTHVELISPLPKEEKTETPKVVETVLKVDMHCQSSANAVIRCILKIQGVQIVNLDVKKSHVTVKSAIDPKKLVAYITKKTGQHAEVVNANNNNKQTNNYGDAERREGGGDQDWMNAAAGYPNFPPDHVYAPQFFSDENPNACSIV